MLGFALPRFVIGLKISRHFLIQSDVKPELITTRTHFLALSAAVDFIYFSLIGSLDFLCPLFGQSDHFVLVFLHSVENRSIMCKRISVNWEQLLTPDYVRLLTRILCFCCKKTPPSLILSRSIVGMSFLYKFFCLLAKFCATTNSRLSRTHPKK